MLCCRRFTGPTAWCRGSWAPPGLQPGTPPPARKGWRSSGSSEQTPIKHMRPRVADNSHSMCPPIISLRVATSTLQHGLLPPGLPGHIGTDLPQPALLCFFVALYICKQNTIHITLYISYLLRAQLIGESCHQSDASALISLCPWLKAGWWDDICGKE